MYTIIPQVLVSLALFGAASAMLSCEDCSMIGTAISEYSISEGIKW